jgi:hypothetical protein
MQLPSTANLFAGARDVAGSAEQSPPVPVIAVGDAGQGEQVAAAERQDVVEEGLVDEPFLDGFELAAHVLLVAGEDVPGGQIAVLVNTEVVAVRTADYAPHLAAGPTSRPPSGASRTPSR